MSVATGQNSETVSMHSYSTGQSVFVENKESAEKKIIWKIYLCATMETVFFPVVLVRLVGNGCVGILFTVLDPVIQNITALCSFVFVAVADQDDVPIRQLMWEIWLEVT